MLWQYYLVLMMHVLVSCYISLIYNISSWGNKGSEAADSKMSTETTICEWLSCGQTLYFHEKKKECLGQYIEKSLYKINKLHGDVYVSKRLWFLSKSKFSLQRPYKMSLFYNKQGVILSIVNNSKRTIKMNASHFKCYHFVFYIKLSSYSIMSKVIIFPLLWLC